MPEISDNSFAVQPVRSMIWLSNSLNSIIIFLYFILLLYFYLYGQTILFYFTTSRTVITTVSELSMSFREQFCFFFHNFVYYVYLYSFLQRKKRRSKFETNK